MIKIEQPRADINLAKQYLASITGLKSDLLTTKFDAPNQCIFTFQDNEDGVYSVINRITRNLQGSAVEDSFTNHHGMQICWDFRDGRRVTVTCRYDDDQVEIGLINKVDA